MPAESATIAFAVSRPMAAAFGEAPVTVARGNWAETLGSTSFPARSRIVAPSARPIGPTVRRPEGAESPGRTTVVKVSLFVPLPSPSHAASRVVPPMVIGRVNRVRSAAVTNTGSVNRTTNDRVLPAA